MQNGMKYGELKALWLHLNATWGSPVTKKELRLGMYIMTIANAHETMNKMAKARPAPSWPAGGVVTGPQIACFGDNPNSKEYIISSQPLNECLHWNKSSLDTSLMNTAIARLENRIRERNEKD